MLLISLNIKGQENECQMLRMNEWGILPKSYSWQLSAGGDEVTCSQSQDEAEEQHGLCPAVMPPPLTTGYRVPCLH